MTSITVKTMTITTAVVVVVVVVVVLVFVVAGALVAVIVEAKMTIISHSLQLTTRPIQFIIEEESR